MPWTVIPANAGIQIVRMLLDPRFRGGDDGDQFFNGLLAVGAATYQSSQLLTEAATNQLETSRGLAETNDCANSALCPWVPRGSAGDRGSQLLGRTLHHPPGEELGP